MDPARLAKFLLATTGGTPAARIAACDRLVRAGYFEEADGPLQALAQIEGTATEARKLLAVSRQLKRWGIIGKLERYVGPNAGVEDALDFSLDGGVFIARRPAAKKLIFVFSGAAKQIWISLHLLHQLLPQDCHVVYIQDHDGWCYLTGVKGFGDSYERAVEGMRALLGSLGDPQVYCIGSSGGGHAALRYGIELGVCGVLAFSPSTDMGGLAQYFPDTLLDDLGHGDPEAVIDVKDRYLAHPSPPRVMIVYGADHERDARQAKLMGDLPSVSLYPIANYDRHDVISQTIAIGVFPELIQTLLEN